MREAAGVLGCFFRTGLGNLVNLKKASVNHDESKKRLGFVNQNKVID